MSQENFEVVREGYEAFAEGFAEGDFDRLFAGLDPEIELDLSRRLLEPEIFRGHEGLREFLRRQREDWSNQRVEPMGRLESERMFDNATLVSTRERAVGARAHGPEEGR